MFYKYNIYYVAFVFINHKLSHILQLFYEGTNIKIFHAIILIK